MKKKVITAEDLGDVENFVYGGLSEDGAKRYYVSSKRMAIDGERKNAGFLKDDTPELRKLKRGQMKVEVANRVREIEKDLRLMDARVVLCGQILEKGVITSVDFKALDPRDQSKVKSKFVTAINSDRIELSNDEAEASGQVDVDDEGNDEDLDVVDVDDEGNDEDLGDDDGATRAQIDALVADNTREGLDAIAAQFGIEDPETHPNKTDVARAIVEAENKDAE